MHSICQVLSELVATLDALRRHRLTAILLLKRLVELVSHVHIVLEMATSFGLRLLKTHVHEVFVALRLFFASCRSSAGVLLCLL